MSYYNRFGEDYVEEMDKIHARRDSLIDALKQHIPENVVEIAEQCNVDEEPHYDLAWVTVDDPRDEYLGIRTIDVKPVFEIGWLEDGSGHGSEAGVGSVQFYGKMPSGEESIIGSLQLDEPRRIGDDPQLFIQINPKAGVEFTRWDSADAELFLKLAESVVEQLPATE